MSDKSIADRKKSFLEDCCGGAMGGGPTMSGGDAMYTSASPAEGPTAGYDKPLGKKRKKDIDGMGRRLRGK